MTDAILGLFVDVLKLDKQTADSAGDSPLAYAARLRSQFPNKWSSGEVWVKRLTVRDAAARNMEKKKRTLQQKLERAETSSDSATVDKLRQQISSLTASPSLDPSRGNGGEVGVGHSEAVQKPAAATIAAAVASPSMPVANLHQAASTPVLTPPVPLMPKKPNSLVYTPQQPLGGFVWKTTANSELLLARYFNDEVVVKRVLRKNSHDDEERFRREMDVHMQLRHDNILPLRCWFFNEENRLHLVMDRMPMSLSDFIRKHRAANDTVPLAEVLRILCGISRGLTYLRGFSARGRVMHRDLNPNNILLNSNGEAKISDFGLAKEFDATQRHTSNVFATAPYAAPEMFSQVGGYNEKIDIFSFGHLIYTLLTVRFPHEGVPDHVVAGALSAEANCNGPEYRPVVPAPRKNNHIDVKLLDLMRRCWKKRPLERPSADEIYKELAPIWNSRDTEPLLWTPEERFALLFHIGLCAQPSYQGRPDKAIERLNDIGKRAKFPCPWRLGVAEQGLGIQDISRQSFYGFCHTVYLMRHRMEEGKPPINPELIKGIVDHDYGAPYLSAIYPLIRAEIPELCISEISVLPLAALPRDSSRR